MLQSQSTYDEKQLLELLKCGHKQAFNALFDHYNRQVYRFAYGYLKLREDAEEIVQDSFVKVWETRNTIDEDQSFSGYLFTIAHHLVLNRIRQKRRQKARLENALFTYTDEQQSFEQELYAQDLEQLTQVAITSMPPKRKAIYEMSRQGQLTHQQISEELHISKKTVEAQITEALKHIRKILATHSHWFPSMIWLLYRWLFWQ